MREAGPCTSSTTATGGTVLVALLFWYTYGGNSRGRGALERANELVHAHVSEADR